MSSLVTCKLQRLSEWAIISPLDVALVTANLREIDKYEAVSVGIVKPGECAQDTLDVSTIAGCLYYRDRPAFLFGAVETGPRIFSIWGYGTDDTWRVLPELTRVCKEVIGPELFDKHGARRLFVQLPLVPFCDPNISWLQRVGFIPEGVAKFATAFDEPMLTLAFTKQDYEKYVFRRRQAQGDNTAASSGTSHPGP
jgi:hypothetical protein